MSELTIITNNVPRPLFCLHELPPKAQKEFDYVRERGDYSPRFVQYKGEWYDVGDAIAVSILSDPGPFADWHSCTPDTFFSGVLFKIVDDERVIVGRYYS